MNKVLMYHSIGPAGTHETGSDLYSVSADNFRQQIEYITGAVISFDDGLLNNYTVAYPILKEKRLKSYFFILVSKVGTPDYMNWQQIKDLQDNGMIIGSHGMTHRILTEINDSDLDYELKESKKILEEKLRQEVKYFSIPRGFYNRKVTEKAKSFGYENIFTSDAVDSDGFKIGRIAVKGSWNLKYFIRVINSGLSFKDKAGELFKNSSKKILGAKSYDKLRSAILRK